MTCLSLQDPPAQFWGVNRCQVPSVRAEPLVQPCRGGEVSLLPPQYSQHPTAERPLQPARLKVTWRSGKEQPGNLGSRWLCTGG